MNRYILGFVLAFLTIFAMVSVALALPPKPPLPGGAGQPGTPSQPAPQGPQLPPQPSLPPCPQCEEFVGTPTPTSTPTLPPGQLGTPTPPPVGGQPSDAGGGGGAGGGDGVGGGEVKGLSTTSGESPLEAILAFLGIASIILGSKLRTGAFLSKRVNY